MPQSFRYLTALSVLFVSVLIVANIASTKMVVLGPLTFDAGTLVFPVAYIVGDLLTEVYGYRTARRVIWYGFGGLLFTGLTLALVNALPAPPDAQSQQMAGAFGTLLGQAPRILLASLVAYLVGEWLNSYVLARLKVAMQGRWMPVRTIASSLIGQGADTAIFLLIAFAGIWPAELLWAVFLANYLFKVGMEVALTPVTVQLARQLKRREQVDAFDADLKLNPLSG